MHKNRIKQGIKENIGLKRQLRTNMTFAEKKLWTKIQKQQVNGLKFRRQHGIGQYIVDFYCPAYKLIIEVDGDTHTEKTQMIKDNEREKYMKDLGINIVRYTNIDVIKNLDGVMEYLLNHIKEYSTSPSPSLQRRGKRAKKDIIQ